MFDSSGPACRPTRARTPAVVSTYAQLVFDDAEPLFDQYRRIDFTRPHTVQADLARKRASLKSLEQAYVAVVSTGDGRNGIAALTRIGEAYADFAAEDSPGAHAEGARRRRIGPGTGTSWSSSPRRSRSARWTPCRRAWPRPTSSASTRTGCCGRRTTSTRSSPGRIRRRRASRSVRPIRPLLSPRPRGPRRWPWARGVRDEPRAASRASWARRSSPAVRARAPRAARSGDGRDGSGGEPPGSAAAAAKTSPDARGVSEAPKSSIGNAAGDAGSNASPSDGAAARRGAAGERTAGRGHRGVPGRPVAAGRRGVPGGAPPGSGRRRRPVQPRPDRGAARRRGSGTLGVRGGAEARPGPPPVAGEPRPPRATDRPGGACGPAPRGGLPPAGARLRAGSLGAAVDDRARRGQPGRRGEGRAPRPEPAPRPGRVRGAGAGLERPRARTARRSSWPSRRSASTRRAPPPT